MLVKCIIDSTRSVKDGLKITLALDKKQKAEFLKHQANFDDKPLEVDFRIDDVEQKFRLSMISPEQRRKVYAILKDITDHIGDNLEAVKRNMKQMYIQSHEAEDFSLSNCSSGTASSFIAFLIAWCFMNAVGLKEHPKELIEDLDLYLWLCLKYKKCVICGQPAEEHHVDAIGMGRDRTKVDDSENLKMALCGEHHRTGKNSIHNLGVETFCERNHVYGIKFTG